MPRILISNSTSTRPYYVDSGWDDFAPKTLPITQYQCEELLAYYRGEEVTPMIVERIRLSVCNRDAPLPLPIRSIGRALSFECSDGLLETWVDLSTFKRHFELVSDLYDLDPSLSLIQVPFGKSVVSDLIYLVSSGSYHRLSYSLRDCLLPLMKYMRPFRASAFLDTLMWSETREVDFLTEFVAPNMTWEDKLKGARWSTIVPDDSVWPLIEHLHSRNLLSVIETLLSDRPLALLIYHLLTSRINMDTLSLIQRSSYEDEREVNLDLGPINTRVMVETIASALKESRRFITLTDAQACLSLLGIHHERIGNAYLSLHCPLGDYLEQAVDEDLKESIIKSFFSISRMKGECKNDEAQVLKDLVRVY